MKSKSGVPPTVHFLPNPKRMFQFSFRTNVGSRGTPGSGSVTTETTVSWALQVSSIRLPGIESSSSKSIEAVSRPSPHPPEIGKSPRPSLTSWKVVESMLQSISWVDLGSLTGPVKDYDSMVFCHRYREASELHGHQFSDKKLLILLVNFGFHASTRGGLRRCHLNL